MKKLGATKQSDLPTARELEAAHDQEAVWTGSRSLDTRCPPAAIDRRFLVAFARKAGFLNPDSYANVPTSSAVADLKALGALDQVNQRPGLAKEIVSVNPAAYLHLSQSARANIDVARAAYENGSRDMMWPLEDIVAAIPHGTLPGVFAAIDVRTTDPTKLGGGFFDDAEVLAEKIRRNPRAIAAGTDAARNSPLVVAAIKEWIDKASDYDLRTIPFADHLGHPRFPGDVGSFPSQVLADPHYAGKLVSANAAVMGLLPVDVQAKVAGAFETAIRGGRSFLKLWAAPAFEIPASTLAKLESLDGLDPTKRADVETLELALRFSALGGYPLVAEGSSFRKRADVAIAFVNNHDAPEDATPAPEAAAYQRAMSYVDPSLNDHDLIGELATSNDPGNIYWLSARLQRALFTKALSLDGNLLSKVDPKFPEQAGNLAGALGDRLIIGTDGKLKLTERSDALTAAKQSGQVIVENAVPSIASDRLVGLIAVGNATRRPSYDAAPGADVLAATKDAEGHADLAILARQVAGPEQLCQWNPRWNLEPALILELARQDVSTGMLFGGIDRQTLDHLSVTEARILRRAVKVAGPDAWAALPDCAFKADRKTMRAALMGWEPDPAPWLDDNMRPWPLQGPLDPRLLEELRRNDRFTARLLEDKPRAFPHLSEAQRTDESMIAIGLGEDAGFVQNLPERVLDDPKKLGSLILRYNPLALEELVPARRALVERACPEAKQRLRALTCTLRQLGFDKHMERFNGNYRLIAELVRNRTTPIRGDARPVALCLMSDRDPVHAMAFTPLDDLVKRGFRVQVYNIKKKRARKGEPPGFLDAPKEVGEQKKCALMVIMSHGRPSKIILKGPVNYRLRSQDALSVADLPEIQEANLAQYLEKGAPCAIIACETALGAPYQMDFAKAMSLSLPDNPVYASKISTDFRPKFRGRKLLDLGIFGTLGQEAVIRRGESRDPYAALGFAPLQT